MTRVFPAIDIRRSGTRKEELLLSKDHLEVLWAIRKSMSDSPDFVEKFLRKLKQSKTNDEFVEMIKADLKVSSSRRVV